NKNDANCQTGKDQVRGYLHVFDAHLDPLPGSPFTPDPNPDTENQSASYLKVLPLGSLADPKTRKRGADRLNFYFKNENAIQAGHFTFKFEIDPRKPNVFPASASQPNEKTNLVQVLADRNFVSTSKPERIGALLHPNLQ